MRLISVAPVLLSALASTLFTPTAQAVPEGFPDIDSFEPVTWNDFLAGGDDAGSVHVEFTTPSGLTCFLNVNAYSYECWGPLHGAPAGANHVRGNVVDNQPAPDLEAAPNLLPSHSKISWRGVTCGADGPLTVCYQVDHGFILSDKETKVFPAPESAAPGPAPTPLQSEPAGH